MCDVIIDVMYPSPILYIVLYKPILLTESGIQSSFSHYLDRFLINFSNGFSACISIGNNTGLSITFSSCHLSSCMGNCSIVLNLSLKGSLVISNTHIRMEHISIGTFSISFRNFPGGINIISRVYHMDNGPIIMNESSESFSSVF